MRYPQLVLGMLGIFVYVGVEVTIVSNFSELLKQPAFGRYQSSQVAPFISMYWGSLMIGRWTGRFLFSILKVHETNMMFIVPLEHLVLSLGSAPFHSMMSGHCFIIFFVCLFKWLPFILARTGLQEPY